MLRHPALHYMCCVVRLIYQPYAAVAAAWLASRTHRTQPRQHEKLLAQRPESCSPCFYDSEVRRGQLKQSPHATRTYTPAEFVLRTRSTSLLQGGVTGRLYLWRSDCGLRLF